MACEETCKKSLWQLQFYLKAISERFDQSIHWIWVLNKISEVLCSTEEAAKNYNDLKEMVRQSRKCQGWNFLEKIGEIECQSGFYSQHGKFLSAFGRYSFIFVSRFLRRSFLFWAEYMGRAVEQERGRCMEYAKRLRTRLMECHFSMQNKKNLRFQGMRREAENTGYVSYEEEMSSLLAEEVAVSTELLELVDELKLGTPEKGAHLVCGLCACCHVPEEGMQTTSLDLNKKEVVKHMDHEMCISISKDFQGSVRERLEEQFSTLLEGVFCSHGVFKSKSRKGSKQSNKRKNSKGNLAAQQKVEKVGESQEVGDEINKKQIRDSLTDENVVTQTSGASVRPLCGETDANIPHKVQEGKCPVDEMKIESKDTQIVAEAFIDFANEYSKKPVVILAEYRFESFLRHVKDVAGKGGYITKQKGDFDLIVIIPQIGIFFGQLKDTKDDSCNLKRYICEASGQCQKDKSVFREMFRDRINMFDLPVYEFIALPRVCKEAFDQRCNFSQCSFYSKILTKDDLKDKACFESWLQKAYGDQIDLSDDWVIGKEQYLTLLERFVGFGSEAVIDPYPKLIGDQCFLSPLTDEQRHLVSTDIDDKPFLTLSGDYGTGKSLIIVKRALKIAREINDSKTEREGKVIIVTCSDICVDGEFLDQQFPEHTRHHLQKFCKDQYENIISVETFCSFTEAEYSDLSGSKGVELLCKTISQKHSNDHELHLLFDEVPAKFVEKLQNCPGIFSKCLGFVTSAWFVIGTHSYRVRWDNSSHRQIEDCKPSPNFEHMYLSKVVRPPRKVFDLSQRISLCSGDDHQGSLINSCEGPQPLLFRVPPCDCCGGKHVDGPSRHQGESNPLRYACMEDRLSRTLKDIFYEIGIFKGGKMVDKWPGRVTMLVFGVEDDSLLNELRTLLIKCCKNFEGLRVRDTLKVEGQKGGETVGAAIDQGNHDASLVSEEGLDFNQVTTQENQDMDAIECTSSSCDSEGSDSGGLLGFVGKKLAEGESSECEDRIVLERLDYEEKSRMEVGSSSSPEILLTRETHFVGCESHVVICIDLNAMKHWFKNTKVAFSTLAVSRCLSQYVHLTWQDEEAEIMYKMNVEACVEDLDSKDKRNVEDAKKESTLENLLKKGVITEKTVSRDMD